MERINPKPKIGQVVVRRRLSCSLYSWYKRIFSSYILYISVSVVNPHLLMTRVFFNAFVSHLFLDFVNWISEASILASGVKS